MIIVVNGLGHLFWAERRCARPLRKLGKIPYKVAFSASRFTFVFQNTADQELLVELGLVEPNLSSVIRSSGVDLDRFRPHPITPFSVPPFVISL